MDSEWEYMSVSDYFMEDGMSFEEFLASVPKAGNEMNPNGAELCEASYTFRNESSEVVTENHLTSMVSTQQASHADRNSSTQRRVPFAKRERKKFIHSNVVSNDGTQGRWSHDEHQRFLQGLAIYGDSHWKEIAYLVGTRTPSQVAAHAQKFFLRQIQPNKKRSSINDLPVELNPDTPESSSLAALPHSGSPAYVIAPQYIPAQRNPDNVLEGERNFGGSIQPQHLEEQYYPPVMMQLPAPQHHPAQWNPNNFSGGGNIWPIRSPSTELPYYPVTAQMFPGQ